MSVAVIQLYQRPQSFLLFQEAIHAASVNGLLREWGHVQAVFKGDQRPKHVSTQRQARRKFDGA